MKKIIVIAVLALTGCGLLTPAVEQGLNNTGIAVLCTLEEEELADPALDQDCEKLASGTTPGLTPSQQAAVTRHAEKAKAARAMKAAKDGGVQ